MNEDNIMDTSKISWEGDFDNQVQTILRHVRLTAEEVINIRKLYEDLERVLHPHAPGCQVFPFGSVVTGLGIKSSDVDCYIQLPSNLEPTPKSVIYAKKILQGYSYIFKNLFAIPQASVPIVKFFHAPTNFNCDVNFKSFSGVHNSKLIGFMLHLDRRALPLAVLLKYYSKIYKFTGTNLLPSYALIMMIIFYLQQIDILPSVYELQKRIPEYMIDGWNNAYNDNFQQEILNDDSLYVLLGGFFKYYQEFNYMENIISPFIGKVISKKAFLSLSSVPDEFSVYKYNVANEICKPLRVDSKVCVQDPFQHNRNCSMCVFPKLADKIHAHFKFAAEKFKSVTSEHFLKAIYTEDSVPESINKYNDKNKKKPVLHNKIRKHMQNPRQQMQNQYNARFTQMNRKNRRS